MLTYALKSKKSGNYFVYDSHYEMYVDDVRSTFMDTAPTFFDLTTLTYLHLEPFLRYHTIDDVEMVQLKINETGLVLISLVDILSDTKDSGHTVTPINGTIMSISGKILDNIVTLAVANGFEHYTGGGGPTEEHVEKNHRALRNALIARMSGPEPNVVNVDFAHLDVTIEHTNLDGLIDDLEIVKMTNRETGAVRACAYDRWGFCAIYNGVFDQVGLRDTVEYLLTT